ncbi:unnamed protein product, partial [Ectocarpus sp. 12 AP-2014]
NRFKDYSSSAVLYSYGSTECSSYKDTVDLQVYQGGEAAFNVQTGSTGTKIFHATGYSATNFFVYVATGSSGTIVDTVIGEGFYVAGFCAQSDWADPTIAARVPLSWDRPNYTPPTDLGVEYTNWSQNDLDDLMVSNSSFGNGYAGRNTVAFAFVQMDGADGSSVYDVRATLKSCWVHDTTNVSVDLAIWRESGVCELELYNNKFRANAAKLASGGGSTKWSEFIQKFDRNGEVDTQFLSEVLIVPESDTTPSVAS